MSAGPLITDILAAFCLAAVILYRYGNWYRHRIIVTLSVLIAWCFSFLIIFVLPLDVSSAIYRQCHFNGSDPVSIKEEKDVTVAISPSVKCLEPWSTVPEGTFPSLWRIVYWSSQFLTWIVMPLMQSYTQAGEFTIAGKLRSAAIDNVIYYGSYLFIAGILLIYIATKPGMELDWYKLKAIASSASNTWGLFLLVLLLGYALVEVPRGLWNHGRAGYTLQYSYFRVGKLSIDKCEAEEAVDELLDSLQLIANVVKPGHPLHKNVEAVLQRVPVEYRRKMERLSQQEPNENNIPSIKSLVRLHKQVIKALQTVHRTEAQWGLLINKVIFLEDIESNIISRNRRFKHTFPPVRHPLLKIIWNPTIEWYYHCFIHRHLLKLLSILTGALSIIVVWSEMTFFNEKPVLSIFALLLELTIEHYDYFAMELVSTMLIAYLCYCAYSTVLQIKFLNKYYIAPNHQTNEFSLIFSGMMLCRLTPPMCLNFLGLIHMDSHIIKSRHLETAYTQIMGHMDVISDGFNIYFPMLMLLFCIATYFKLGSRFLTCLGSQQFIGDDEFTADLVIEGRELVKREKRRLQRMEETENRRQEFQRFTTQGAARSRERFTNDLERVRRARDTSQDSYDSARAGLLSTDSDRLLDYYVEPTTGNRDHSGRLPKNFFDDV